MDCPVQMVIVSTAVSMLAVGAVGADEASNKTKPVRAISPRVAEMLSAAATKFVPPVKIRAESASAGETSAGGPRLTVADGTAPVTGIIRLPNYVVIERKPRSLPKTEDILGPRELEKLAMREFLGEENGFDRGFLNVVTFAAFLKKVPLLGRIQIRDFETNEDRAMRLYHADRNAKAWAELMGLMSVHGKDAPAANTRTVSPKQPE